MEVENVEELLDYVFTDRDFSAKPTETEYRKLSRIMVIMTRFYERGSATKKKQLDQLLDDLSRLEVDEKMIREQLESVKTFPSTHPKQNEYENDLNNELEALLKARGHVQSAIMKWRELYEWSLKIVDTIRWLAKQLEEYSNEIFKTQLEINPEHSQLDVDLFRIYKRGLDEITYNLQESQDFFDASLDGRLSKFHQIEKDIINAQLNIIRKYPDDSVRRQAIEPEYIKDLEYVSKNMQINPDVISIRERMRKMHQDFFALLKWQRSKILRLPLDFPQKLNGNVEALREEFEAKANQSVSESVDHNLVPDFPDISYNTSLETIQKTSSIKEEGSPSRSCPIIPNITGNPSQCPINQSVSESLKIHRLY